MIDFPQISLCLNTKEHTYPKEILDHVLQLPWGEILILTHSDSPYRKHELFTKAKYETLAYQDDDAIVPWADIVELSQHGIINVAMKKGHYEAHKNSRATMGIGWGAIFPKAILKELKRYTDVYGEDEVYRRETERILTYLSYPQNRLILPIQDLPSAYNSDRLWLQPEHNRFKQLAEEQCSGLMSEHNTDS